MSSVGLLQRLSIPASDYTKHTLLDLNHGTPCRYVVQEMPPTLLPAGAADRATEAAAVQAAAPVNSTVGKEAMEPCSNCQRYVADALRAKQRIRALVDKLESAHVTSEELRIQLTASEKVCLSHACHCRANDKNNLQISNLWMDLWFVAHTR
jgi:hypothetical protein